MHVPGPSAVVDARAVDHRIALQRVIGGARRACRRAGSNPARPRRYPARAVNLASSTRSGTRIWWPSSRSMANGSALASHGGGAGIAPAGLPQAPCARPRHPDPHRNGRGYPRRANPETGRPAPIAHRQVDDRQSLMRKAQTHPRSSVSTSADKQRAVGARRRRQARHGGRNRAGYSAGPAASLETTVMPAPVSSAIDFRRAVHGDGDQQFFRPTPSAADRPRGALCRPHARKPVKQKEGQGSAWTRWGLRPQTPLCLD